MTKQLNYKTMTNKLPKGAIGFRDNMSEDELAGKHVDGLSGAVFDTEEAYLNHTSEVTGYKPTEPEHLGEDFVRISEEALKRGEARKGEEIHPAEAAAKGSKPARKGKKKRK